MAEKRPISDSDQAFLDFVFDQALEQLQDGLSVDIDALLEGRLELRDAAEDLIRLAEEVTTGRPPPTPILPGYTVLAELGRGGMGAVYLARQQQAGGRVVALKVLPALAGMSPRARERFRAEAHTLAQLRHPNIVTVHDVIDTGEVCAYCMEWVDGTTLAELLRQLSGLDRYPTFSDVRVFLKTEPEAGDDPKYVQFVCRLGIAVARALDVVHAVGLVHRDVKPSNILLRRDGTPLLSDFGLVREVDSTVHTQSGHFVGTAAYASPEQLRGESDAVDRRSDVYSLGVTLCHALTLQSPFSGRGPLEVLRQVERGAVLGMRRKASALPKDLETIIAKAMDPDPVRRYATAGELADDLQRLLNLQPIRARPAGPVTKTLKFARRNRATLFATIMGAALMLLASVGVALYMLVLPRWADAELTKARIALLDPEQRVAIFAAEFFGGPSNSVPRMAGSTFPVTLKTALQHYDAALRLRPFAHEIRQERDVVAEVAEHSFWDSGELTPNDAAHGRDTAIQQSTDAAALRLRGLRSFLLVDAKSAIEAWSRLDLLQDPDPFVEAAMGYVYLAREEPARAYPRLRESCKAIPDVGFMNVYLADAAVQCGDLAKAEQLLKRARNLQQQDPNMALERVTADLLAAQGRDEEAEALYERIDPGEGLAKLHHARLLEARGRLFEALRVYREVVAGLSFAKRPKKDFIPCAEKWWNALPDDQRYALARASLDNDPTGGEFFDTLRLYAGVRDPLDGRQENPGPTQTAWMSASGKPTEPQAAGSRLSLQEIVERMEVENMFLWDYVRELPDDLKDSLAAAWLAPRMASEQHVVLGLAKVTVSLLGADSPAWRLVRIVLGMEKVPAPVSAQCPSYDFVAEYSGRSNPTGPWSYGSTSQLGEFELSTVSVIRPYGRQDWESGKPYSPTVGRNISSRAVPGEISLHPGPLRTEMAVARWTAPVAGNALVSGAFDEGAPGTVTVYVLHNSTVRFQQFATAVTVSFNFSVALNVGDTIDFVVHNNGVWDADSTPTRATITYTCGDGDQDGMVHPSDPSGTAEP